MSVLSELPVREICLENVRQQFNRRGALEGAQFLYSEVARRMAEKLDYILCQPKRIVDVGCNAGQAYPMLLKRYPDAHYSGLDFSESALTIAQKLYSPSFTQRLTSLFRKSSASLSWHMADAQSSGLATASYDMLWSNLMLHWHPRPHAVLEEWARLLQDQGLLLFSCFGPNTCKELRDAVQRAGISTQGMAWVDMHDFGDLLLQRGFSQPVMDQEILSLTYTSAETLLRDVRELGGNPSTQRQRGLLSRQAYQKLCDSIASQRREDGLIYLTVEVCYGHAWRALAQHSQGSLSEFSIPISAIQRKS